MDIINSCLTELWKGLSEIKDERFPAKNIFILIDKDESNPVRTTWKLMAIRIMTLL